VPDAVVIDKAQPGVFLNELPIHAQVGDEVFIVDGGEENRFFNDIRFFIGIKWAASNLPIGRAA
jgi:hypothetical protein